VGKASKIGIAFVVMIVLIYAVYLVTSGEIERVTPTTSTVTKQPTIFTESVIEQEKVMPANHELCSVWNEDCEGNESKSSIGLISTYVRDKIIPDEVIDVELVNDRYYGLTENQIMHVKMIEESCDTKTFEVELFSGKTASELYAQKCDEAVLNKIEGYR
jgi:hypothetical protein